MHSYAYIYSSPYHMWHLIDQSLYWHGNRTAVGSLEKWKLTNLFNIKPNLTFKPSLLSLCRSPLGLTYRCSLVRQQRSIALTAAWWYHLSQSHCSGSYQGRSSAFSCFLWRLPYHAQRGCLLRSLRASRKLLSVIKSLQTRSKSVHLSSKRRCRSAQGPRR